MLSAYVEVSPVKFAKMQGNGNDFIILDNREEKLSQGKIQTIAIKLCRRRLSIGADGLIVLDAPTNSHSSFSMLLLNRDGSESPFSGNAARCAARFAYEKKFAGNQMTFDTKGGVIKAQVEPPLVTLELGKLDTSKIVLDKTFNYMDESLPVNYMHLGWPQSSPHCVVFLEKNDWRPMESLAPFARAIQKNKELFPDGVNVNFLKILDHYAIEVYTYERGVDEFTLSCGSGSVAAAIAAWINGWCDSPVEVYNPGGTNTIIVEPTCNENLLAVKLRGKTALVAEGTVFPEAL